MPAAGEREWDVIVIGAGPAGALAARELARDGSQVLLVDKATFPRRKVCGCCLNLRALATLRDAGIAQRIAVLGPRPLRQLRLAAGGREARVDLPGGVSLSRERFDTALIDGAVEAGAVFLQGRRARLIGDPGTGGFHGVELARAGDELPFVTRARVVIAADGLGGASALDRLGGERLHRSSRVGAGAVLEASVRSDWADGAINMAIGREGYVGAVRLEDGRWNLAAALDGVAVRRHGDVPALVCEVLREAGWSVPDALRDAAWRGTPRLWRRPGRVAAERLFAVGDAAGYVEPFTGEGMAWALAAGLAVAPLVRQALRHWEPALADQWTRTLRRDVHRGQTLCRASASLLGRPRVATGITGILAAWPGLAAPAIRRLNAVDFAPREGGVG
jgi:flavin-dependent dehydrogenase